MNRHTRQQLKALSLAFYEAHAQAFDASRVELPWPGWHRVAAELAGDHVPPNAEHTSRANEANPASPAAPSPPTRILDIGCGNGRFAAFLQDQGLLFDFIGVDANADLLAAARSRVEPTLPRTPEWIQQDFLDAEPVGAELPEGPFDAIVLMGVMHHVPSAENRLALLESAARRLAPRGLLALTAWQFATQPRFHRRMVEWSSVRAPDGMAVDPDELEPGDHLLRFGDDPTRPPRYCHQVSDAEFETWPAALGLETVDTFHADGPEGDLNRYWLLRAA